LLGKKKVKKNISFGYLLSGLHGLLWASEGHHILRKET
jgi:hypothetical protein